MASQFEDAENRAGMNAQGAAYGPAGKGQGPAYGYARSNEDVINALTHTVVMMGEALERTNQKLVETSDNVRELGQVLAESSARLESSQVTMMQVVAERMENSQAAMMRQLSQVLAETNARLVSTQEVNVTMVRNTSHEK